jgi:hypothetical protein
LIKVTKKRVKEFNKICIHINGHFKRIWTIKEEEHTVQISEYYRRDTLKNAPMKR